MKSFNQWLSEDPYVTDPQTNKSLVGRIANVRKKTFDVDIEGKHLIRCAKVNDPNLLFLQDVSSGKPFGKDVLQAGQTVLVHPRFLENEYQNVILDQTQVVETMTHEYVWEVLDKAYQGGNLIKGRILNANEKGFTVGLGGITANLPFHQLLELEEELSESEWKRKAQAFLGKLLYFRILVLNQEKGLVGLSRKMVW